MRRGLIITGLVLAFLLGGCSSALVEENAELKAQIAALEQENKMLNSENERLSGLVTDLGAAVKELNKVIGKTLPHASASSN